ncbi:cadherin repeat domain-containing protein [bacterium]|nr:cadherin repeat domain-containing protein [bacterium]MCI0602980.1 cadherin repeat domain-containing protein [bacterium]
MELHQTSQPFTIHVSGENSAPVLDPIGNKTINEGQPLTFTATATDPNSGQVLTFSLQGDLPDNATIDPVTGVFNWTATDQQAGTYQLTITVSDNGTPALSDEETITITVNEFTPPVNNPPVLGNVPAETQSVLVGDTLSFQATGSDPDDSDTVTFSLQGTVPIGA